MSRNEMLARNAPDDCPAASHSQTDRYYGEAVNRSTVSECAGNVRWKEADASVIVSSFGEIFVGSSTVFAALRSSPLRTITFAFLSTEPARRRLMPASIG